MNDAWKRISKKYIDCHEAIKTLYDNGIIDDDMLEQHERKLLNDIIETFRSEVEE